MPIHYTDPSLDVPPGVDFLDDAQARAWVAVCEADKPWRIPMRQRFVELLQALPEDAEVLELGAGPGLLAETILRHCPNVSKYTLLDFSYTMLTVSRERLREFPRAQFLSADFKKPDWTAGLRTDYSAVVAMQAVHEIRHKRHVPGLYRQVARHLRPGGRLIVCDGTPRDDSLVRNSLYMTPNEQVDAFHGAGFVDVEVKLTIGSIVLVSGTLPSSTR